MDVTSEQIVTDSEARETLEQREKGGEMKYEQKNALEILRKFVTVSPDKIKTLVTELFKISKLRDRHVVAIANFLPEDRDDLRAILHKDYGSFTEDEVNLILETVKKFV